MTFVSRHARRAFFVTRFVFKSINAAIESLREHAYRTFEHDHGKPPSTHHPFQAHFPGIPPPSYARVQEWLRMAGIENLAYGHWNLVTKNNRLDGRKEQPWI